MSTEWVQNGSRKHPEWFQNGSRGGIEILIEKSHRTNKNVKQEIVSVSDEIIMSDVVNQLERDIKII